MHSAWSAALLALWLLAPPAFAADVPQSDAPVTLSVNPDGTVVWNGERLPNKPALENRLVRRTQESPKLELDVQFQSNGFQTDSNRKTLTDLLELTARFGYVHIVNSADGVRLIVLGPTVGDAGR